MLLLNLAHNNKHTLKLDHTLLYYTKRMVSSELNARDLGVFSYSPTLRYQNLAFSTSFDKIKTGDNNDFLNIKIAPSIFTKLDNANSVKATLNLSRQLYSNDDDAKKELDKRELDIKYFYNQFTLGALYAKDTKRDEGAFGVDKKYYGFSVAAKIELNHGIISTITYDILQTKYHDDDSWFFSKREDKKKQFSINNTKAFDKQNTGVLYMNFVDNDSNQAPYVYDKYVLGMNYMRSFSW